MYVKHISIINLYHLICHEILMGTVYTHIHTCTYCTNQFKLEHLDIDVDDVNRTGQMHKLEPNIFLPCEPHYTAQQHQQQLQMRLHNLNPITLAINRI